MADEEPCQACGKPLLYHAIPCEVEKVEKVEKASQPQAPIPTNFANIISRASVQALM